MPKRSLLLSTTVCWCHWQVNFDSFLQSLLTLYQMLVGAAWSVTMSSSLLTFSANSGFMLYFVSFVLLVGVLFANLFLGIVISSFEGTKLSVLCVLCRSVDTIVLCRRSLLQWLGRTISNL